MGTSLREIIVDFYQKRIFEADIPNELRRALKTHERVPLFVNNLVKELIKVPGLKLTQIKDATNSLTDLFIASVKAHAEQRTLSSAERERIDTAYKTKRVLTLEAEAAALDWQKSRKKAIDQRSRERVKSGLKIVN